MSTVRKWAKTTIAPSYSAKLETVTPKQAQEWLDKNTNNRRLNERNVKFYQQMMEQDRWQVNGESIKIADNGTLLDGQHRLQAIVNYGKPVKTFVSYGLSTEAFQTIDAGKSRSHADYLKINGTSCNEPQVLAAAARVAMSFNTQTGEYVYSTNRVSPPTLIQWVDNHTGLENAIDAVGKWSIKSLASKSVSSGLYYIFSVLDPEAAETFFYQLSSGANLKEGSPVLALRNRLIASRGTGRAGAGHTKMTVAYFVSAFNAYRAGRSLTTVSYSPERLVVLNDFAGAMK